MSTHSNSRGIMKVVVRHIKHKSLGTIGAAASHTMRKRPTANADPSKPAPEVWVGSSSPADDVREVLPEKRRKNAVLALEYVLTASPEFFANSPQAEWRDYLRGQLVMLQGYYREENVVSAVLHLDEMSPHLAVMIVPLVDGKLNARALIGTREACSIVQDLAGEAGKAFGLERGKRGSKARHQDVKDFYADIGPARLRASVMAAELVEQADALEAGKRDLAHRLAAVQDEQERLSLLAASLAPIEEERAARLHGELTAQHRHAVLQSSRALPSSGADRGNRARHPSPGG